MKSRIRILLIDDDEEEYILTQNLLSDRSYHTGSVEQTGFDLDWVATYEEGLVEILSGQHDVYLVDYQLGKRNGLELIQEAIARECRAPIILMTGQGNYQVDVEAMQAGATDYLVKGEVSPTLMERTIRYAIERRRAEEKIRKNAERAELLAALSQAFVEAGLYYPAVLSTIAHKIAELTGDACLIRLLSDDGNWLDPVAFHHPDPAALVAIRDKLASDRIEVPASPDGEALKYGKPVILPRLPREPELPGSGFQDALVVPLSVKDRLIGTLGVYRTQPGNGFTQEDQLFYQDLADRAALAIENARLYVAEAQRARELDALHTATAALLSTIDLETLLTRILDSVQSAIPASDRGLLHLTTSDHSELKILTESVDHDPRINIVQFLQDQTYIDQVVRGKLPLLIQDTQTDSDLHQIALPLDLTRFRSAIVAPLIHGSEFLGLISLVSDRPSVFTEADKRLLMSFANMTTAALQNAILHSEVQRLAMTDSLTGVFNRRGFFEFGRREVERASRFGRPLSALMVDIDYFKKVNDSHGHAVGDRVLHILAERLKTSIREIDILGRYGGDEFVILLPETDPLSACAVAERIRARLTEPIILNRSSDSDISTPLELSLTASLGVTNINSNGQDLASLLARADTAAYLAKQRGRNRVELS